MENEHLQRPLLLSKPEDEGCVTVSKPLVFCVSQADAKALKENVKMAFTVKMGGTGQEEPSLYYVGE